MTYIRSNYCLTWPFEGYKVKVNEFVREVCWFRILNKIYVNGYQCHKYWMSWDLSIPQMVILASWIFLIVKHNWMFNLQIKLLIMNIYWTLFNLGKTSFSIQSFSEIRSLLFEYIEIIFLLHRFTRMMTYNEGWHSDFYVMMYNIGSNNQSCRFPMFFFFFSFINDLNFPF